MRRAAGARGDGGDRALRHRPRGGRGRGVRSRWPRAAAAPDDVPAESGRGLAEPTDPVLLALLHLEGAAAALVAGRVVLGGDGGDELEQAVEVERLHDVLHRSELERAAAVAR